VLEDSATPVRVTGISGGGRVRCALLRGGEVKCWGRNAFAQIARSPTAADFGTPVDVTWLTGAKMVASTTEETCAVLGDSTAQCAGSGQL
jgi:hypothetical protein